MAVNMNVQSISLADLKPYETNPRRNDGAVDAVANSIRKFGFRVPLVIDADNVIVCGHTRYKAAQKLGLESVPCVIADDLSPEQIKAFRLADNKPVELASWDFEKLDYELVALSGLNLESISLNMADFGFIMHDNTDIDNFFEEITPCRQAAPLNNLPQNHSAESQNQTVTPKETESEKKFATDEVPAEKTEIIICPHCGKGFAL